MLEDIIKKKVTTTVDRHLKKLADIEDICFARAMEIGIKILLKRKEGLAGLINEDKKIKNHIELLNHKSKAIQKEINDLKIKETEKKELEKHEEQKKENICQGCGENLLNRKRRPFQYKGKKYCRLKCYEDSENKQ